MSIIEPMVRSSRRDGEAMPHCLFYGPPGTGKTHMAREMAVMRGVPFHRLMGATFDENTLANLVIGGKSLPLDGYRRQGETFTKTSVDLVRPAVVCIDECEETSRKMLERLFPLIENRPLSERIIQVSRNGVRIRVWVPPFTLVLTTNFPGDIKTPAIRSRCQIEHRFDPVDNESLVSILARSQAAMSHEAAMAIARRSLGIPRNAIKMAGMIQQMWRDRHGDCRGHVDADFASRAMDTIGVDHVGLDRQARSYLEELCKRTRASEQTMSMVLSEDPKTIRKMIEPTLVRLGLIEIVPGGRMITNEGRRHVCGDTSVDVIMQSH